MRRLIFFPAVLTVLLAIAAPAAGQQPKKVPILLDIDIGTGIDGACALALALASPEVDLRGVTTCGGNASDRAWLACRLLTQVGRRDIPVAAGADPQADDQLDWQIQYRRHPAAIFNRTSKPLKEMPSPFCTASSRPTPAS